MVIPELIKFIKEARKRGFQDFQIKEPLIKKGWPIKEIDDAFNSLKPNITENKTKNRLFIYVDDQVLKIIESRAKKNLFTIDEQIADILRRSCVQTQQQKKDTEKLDDLLVGLFSRKQRKKR
jgi:hypothetical protein